MDRTKVRYLNLNLAVSLILCRFYLLNVKMKRSRKTFRLFIVKENEDLK